ncbi:MAG: c-type cytochrome biogenesis protein CcmI [Rhodospirillum sp.]|nr:c-type cytochrome biogenesis protein CcmI [Rhodospirillum sp.]MCF8491463.1 c-type cytochrome biogenesis protein CcmI [Rhodospirillum sp.]MCF8498871.1 c-type cytochrome biogenesis protein CcmI [Rhodospirillum sp.]
MIFWLIAIALALATAALLARPLMKSWPGTARRADYDIAVYKDQLTEIDQDVERGVLTTDQADAARVEIQRRILTAASRGEKEGDPKDSSETVPKTARHVVTSLILLIPLASVVLYLGVGSPGMPDHPFAQRMEEMQAQRKETQVEAEKRVIELRAQLEAAPGSLETRAHLARVLLQAGQPDEARSLMAEAAKAAPNDPLTQAEYGQFLVSAANGEIPGEAHATFMRVLTLDPSDPRARFFLGLERLQLGDPSGALAIWRDLKNDTPADAPWVDMLSGQIRDVAMEAGIPPISIKPAHPSAFPADSWSAETAATAQPSPPGEATPGAALRAEADANRAPGQGFSDDEKAMINDMVTGLQDRLKAEPEDFDGWMMLGRSLANLGRPGEAAEVYAKAAALRPDDMTPKRLQARSLIAQSQAEGAAEPPEAVYPLMDAILATDPEDMEAQFFIGLRAANAGDADKARALWTKMLDRLPQDGPLREQIQRRLDALPK